ncbi:hypothetical protein H8356DRAFT_938889 [Neocallimastix lanati (nom. inval.)]|jgi:hypothetical protein|nr:hypothetical protein H8356DRAFT_938889 [Neocallimastix sp. JGI-2020a]
MVFLYRKELKQNKNKRAITNNNNNNSENKNEIINISSPEVVDIISNPNNLKVLPITPATPVTNVASVNILENESINDITMYNSYNSKSYNKKFVSINSEDNILSNYEQTSRQTFDTSSNINDYLSHSYSYNNDKARKHQYHHRKNNSLFVNSSNKRFPSIRKPKPLYERQRQSSISSTIGSVKSMIKRHYSIRSKNHTRHHSSSNSKIPSILIQNNIPLHFINEELDNKASSLNEYCQSVNSSITDNNQASKPKLNYLSTSSNKIKFDEDLPITDVLIPSSSYSFSSNTLFCNNSYENYLYNDAKNENFINTVNNIELNNMCNENDENDENNDDLEKLYKMGYNTCNAKKPEESIYSVPSYSNYSDNLSYHVGNLVEEPNPITEDYQSTNKDYDVNATNLEKMNMRSLDISNLDIEYKKEE